MENSNLAIGALALGAIGIFALSNRASAEPVEGATPFSPLEKQEQDQKKQKIVPADSLVPKDLPSESVWESRGKTFTFEHPLAATNSSYSKYKLKAKLVVDILQSGAYSSWESVPESLAGDYVWELSREGGSWNNPWTVKQSADDIRGTISKSLLAQSVDSIKPNFNSILSAFGGYTPNYPAANEGEVKIWSGDFQDTGGQWRYVDEQGNKVSKQQIVLDLNGNQINPKPIKMQVKCSGASSCSDYGNFVTVVGSQISVMYGTVKYFPPDALDGGYLPSGLPYGCTIPTTSKNLPNSIRVIAESGSNTNYGTSAQQISIDDLITKPTNVVVPNGNDFTTNERVIYDRLFKSLGFPMVHKDAQGYYVLNKYKNHQKAYISTLIPNFNSLYQRRQVQCTCPGGTVKAGQSVTIYDTNRCPSFNSTSEMEEHCGGMSSGGGGSGGGSSSGGSGGLTGGGFTGGLTGSVGSGLISGGGINLQMAEQNLVTNFQSYINW